MNQSAACVYVVDDDAAMRDACHFLLRSVGLRSELYSSADDFLNRMTGAEQGCLVLDIRMPGMGGLELQAELKKRGNHLPIIFISGHGDIPMAVEAVKNGAENFLTKPFRDQELLDCIHAAIEKCPTPGVLSDAAAVRERLASLSPREAEVLRMVTDGNANKVIAIDLGIGQRTVEIHRRNVMEKMQARSLAQLIRMLHLTDYFERV